MATASLTAARRKKLVGRVYAGILGSLALFTVTLRGLKNGSGIDSMLFSGWCSLLLFAGIGLLIGLLAEWIVEDSVRTRFHTELLGKETNDSLSSEASTV